MLAILHSTMNHFKNIIVPNNNDNDNDYDNSLLPKQTSW